MSRGTTVTLLQQFALDHYEEGGHWIYETYSAEEYLEVYREENDDLEATKQELRETWELLEDLSRDANNA